MEPIAKLNSYINSAIPYAWDDSESWFEFLGKVLAKVNEIIMKTNDYFDVDIKQFVVDTLNEWRTNGTLETVLDIVFEDYEERFDNLATQLTQTKTRVNDTFISIDEMGGVGDYYLTDGTINTNPTDNSDIVESIYAQGYKNIRFNKGSYFFSRPINMPKSGYLDLNYCALFFAGDGINLGNHVWSTARVYNGSIYGIPVGGVRAGRGLYTDAGYIVHAQFALSIRLFEEGVKFISQDDNAQLAWSTLDLTIEDCDAGAYFEGGWANTVLFKQLIINRTVNEALFLNNVKQMHEFKIQKLVVEQCATNSVVNKSAVHFKNCINGEFIVDSGYFESNGFSRPPQTNEIEDFLLNGEKISEASQSWLLGEYVYSQDTRLITKQDIGYHSNFFYESCGMNLISRINNVYFATNLYGIASFYNSSYLPIYLNGIHLVNNGYSFPSIRHLFKSNLTNNIVHGKSLTMEGGNLNFISYGEIVFFGDRFNYYGKMEDHITLTRSDTTVVPSGQTVDVNFTSVVEGNPFFAWRRPTEGDILIKEDGIYSIMLRFVPLTVYGSTFRVTFFATGGNSTTSVIPNLTPGMKHTACANMNLKKDDILKVQFSYSDAVEVTIQGANANTFDLMITKL